MNQGGSRRQGSTSRGGPRDDDSCGRVVAGACEPEIHSRGRVLVVADGMVQIQIGTRARFGRWSMPRPPRGTPLDV